MQFLKITFILCIFLLYSRLCTAQSIPYKLNERPLPKGSGFQKIMPEKVGNFTRSKFKLPRTGFDGECLYSDGKTEIFMLFGLAKDYNDTQKTIKVLAMEAETEDVTKKRTVFKKDPSFAKFVSPKGACFIWTRGFYYFLAESKSGEEALDTFIKDFPF